MMLPVGPSSELSFLRFGFMNEAATDSHEAGERRPISIR
jgi:hypothetical protein